MKRVRDPKPKRRQSAPPAARRSRGRPRGGKAAVGREAIVTAARQLLEKLPPHRATIALIARQAGVDPALVRYYFANRERLLLAVIEQLIAEGDPRGPADRPAVEQLTAYLSNMLGFSRRVRSMQRLMVEECAAAKTPEVRDRVRELNARAVGYLATLLQIGDPEDREVPADAVFLQVAIIGMCEFFAAAQPMILPLAPKGTSPAEFARLYEQFIRGLLLDGVRARLEPRAGKRKGTTKRAKTGTA
jgi:AcrR family transcriptional regulator